MFLMHPKIYWSAIIGIIWALVPHALFAASPIAVGITPTIIVAIFLFPYYLANGISTLISLIIIHSLYSQSNLLSYYLPLVSLGKILIFFEIFLRVLLGIFLSSIIIWIMLQFRRLGRLIR